MTFSSGVMGKGTVIILEDGIVTAPCDGIVMDSDSYKDIETLKTGKGRSTDILLKVSK